MSASSISEKQQASILNQSDLLLRWVNDTISLFEKEIKTDSALNHLCITSLTVSLTYCMATKTLLRDGFRMPSKALLRVLFELGAKLVWCVVMPEGEKDPKADIISGRIERWAKSSLHQDVTFLEAIINCLPHENRAEAENRLSQSKKQMEILKCKEMPKLRQILRQLTDVWNKQLYTQCYLQFNNAVHLDISSLGRQEKEGTDRTTVLCDDNDNVEQLMQYCMSLEHIILWIIRHNYGWETDKMDMDFRPEFI